MFAIAFDLVVAETAQHHPKGVSQAYADIGGALANYGFNRDCLAGAKASSHSRPGTASSVTRSGIRTTM